MNSQIKNLVDSKLYNIFLEFAKDDVILQQALKKTDDLKSFLNALLASVICLSEREREVHKMMVGVLQANPEIKKILELKNDPSVLSETKGV